MKNWFKDLSKIAFPLEDAQTRTKRAPSALNVDEITREYIQVKNQYNELRKQIFELQEEKDNLYDEDLGPVQNFHEKETEYNIAEVNLVYDFLKGFKPFLENFKKFLFSFRVRAKHYKNWNIHKDWSLESLRSLWSKNNYGEIGIDQIYEEIEYAEHFSSISSEVEYVLQAAENLINFLSNTEIKEEVREEILIDFNYRNFKFHNKGHLTTEEVKPTLELLDIVIEKLEALGLGHLVYGDVEIYKQLTTSGIYYPSSDLIKIHPTPPGVYNFKWVNTLIHELSHRHWFRFMSSEQRKGYFKEVYSPYFETVEGRYMLEFSEDYNEASIKSPDPSLVFYKDIDLVRYIEFAIKSFKALNSKDGDIDNWDSESILNLAKMSKEDFDEDKLKMTINYLEYFFRTKSRKEKLTGLLYDHYLWDKIFDLVIKESIKKRNGPDLRKNKKYEKYVSIPAPTVYGRTNVEEHFAVSVETLSRGGEMSNDQKRILRKWGNINA